MARKRGKQRVLAFSQESLEAEFKTRVGIRLYEFAKRNFPLKRKLTGKDLYVDSATLTNAIVLTGKVPNAADFKGFSAPINKRISATPHPYKIYGQVWKTISTKTKVGNMGIYARPTTYYGDKHIKLGYFGVKRGGEVTAYGLTATGEALPAYSLDCVTWLAEEQKPEVDRIIAECFAEVFRRQMQNS